jgi:hypothetical protein
VAATCVRVPVETGHAISATVQLERPLSTDGGARARWPPWKGVTLSTGPRPAARDVAGSDDVHVGHMRIDPDLPDVLHLWIVADNLRKGAATNAVQIAEPWRPGGARARQAMAERPRPPRAAPRPPGARARVETSSGGVVFRRGDDVRVPADPRPVRELGPAQGPHRGRRDAGAGGAARGRRRRPGCATARDRRSCRPSTGTSATAASWSTSSATSSSLESTAAGEATPQLDDPLRHHRVRAIPALINQVQALFERLPAAATRAVEWITETRQSAQRWSLPFVSDATIARWLDPERIAAYVQSQQEAITQGAWGTVTGVGRGFGIVLSVLGFLVLTPVLMIYLLKDFDNIKLRVADLVPHVHRETWLDFATEYDSLLSRFLRGQLIAAALVGVLTWLGLWIAGVPYAGLDLTIIGGGPPACSRLLCRAARHVLPHHRLAARARRPAHRALSREVHLRRRRIPAHPRPRPRRATSPSRARSSAPTSASRSRCAADPRRRWLHRHHRSRPYPTRAVLIAGGKGAFAPRVLECPGYETLLGKGVEYHVKDPARYAGKRVLIVGGGDSAVDWVLNLKDVAATRSSSSTAATGSAPTPTP